MKKIGICFVDSMIQTRKDLVILGAQLFTSLKADLSQDIKGGFALIRCLNGTFP